MGKMCRENLHDVTLPNATISRGRCRECERTRATVYNATERGRGRDAAYKVSHHDVLLARSVGYYVIHREQRRAAARTYYATHREQRRAYAATYGASEKGRAADVRFKASTRGILVGERAYQKRHRGGSNAEQD